MNKKLFLILLILILASFTINNTSAARQQVTAGDSYAFAAKTDSTLLTRGDNEDNQLEKRTIKNRAASDQAKEGTAKTTTRTPAPTATTLPNQLIAKGIAPSFDFGSVYIGKEIPSGSMTETFTITTQTGESAGWLLASYPQWLKITPASGTTPDRIVMEVIDTGRLNQGLNSESIIFQSTKNGVNPLKINVSITGMPQF